MSCLKGILSVRVLGIMAMVAGLAACSASRDQSSASLGSGDTANSSVDRELLVANKSMGNDATVFQKISGGGLIADLYIEPRDHMRAPDTQTVGCGQSGDGALGIESYLAQSGWVTQQVLLTDLYVPTRFFQLGFPAPDLSGGILPVKSFFVIDGKGFFKLDPTDTEGDYQFAVIADDGAKLKLGNALNSSPNSFLTIDDQKPAGVNGGCLEQTQSAHMSCTADWSDQSAAKVQTLHVKPGQLVPIDFQYWQGPGNGISMMAFYRKADSLNPLDAACGKELGFDDGAPALADILKTWKPIVLGNLINSSFL
jgi:hypothetical protein